MASLHSLLTDLDSVHQTLDFFRLEQSSSEVPPGQSSQKHIGILQYSWMEGGDDIQSNSYITAVLMPIIIVVQSHTLVGFPALFFPSGRSALSLPATNSLRRGETVL